MRINHQVTIDDSELTFTFSTSPGPGGQNVNKVATRATLHFDLLNSPSLPEAARARLLAALGHRIDRNGCVRVTSSRYRSQSANKEDALERFRELAAAALTPKRVRRPTKPSRASRERRLEHKRRVSQRKSERRSRPGRDD